MTKTYKNLTSFMQKFGKIIFSILIVTVSLTILSDGIFSTNGILVVAEEVSEDVAEVAEEVAEVEYNFAEDTRITGIFVFRDGPEISRFEVFDQKKGFQAGEPFVFELQKVVGSTPLLHKSADLSFQHRNSPTEQQKISEFEVKIVISQGTEQKRTFTYSRCFINNYFVDTKTDNEEGWTQGKGFAVIDSFEIQCQVMKPGNPVYEESLSTKKEPTTRSSMDYQSDQ